ncbi:hypothetical protein [Mucilaginibacter sp. PAMB04168]|uniref:hypothetical protein n=1 Tax=Mucilaginibacter sp. PAMB04168 TaxID=3138567 RepID=UPI0031F60021
MIKTYVTLIALVLACNSSYAQFSTAVLGNTTTNDNVGIGTQTPINKLSVLTNNLGGISIKGNSGTYQGSDFFIGRTSTSPVVGYSPCIQFGEESTIYGALIQSHQGQFQFFNAAESGWHESLRITAGGLVGIGTSTPDCSLTVNGSFKVFTNNNSNYFLYNAADVVLKFSERGTGGRAIVHDFDNRLTLNYNGDFTGGTLLGKYAFFTENASGTSFLSNGNLAIGTTNAHGFRLAVNGNIRAQEIKVEAGPWPDYVFKPTYKLPSLTSVKAYIDKNQHLPEMPSKTTVAKNGVKLGEMNKLLLKKVEELTLYLIRQQEEIEKLKSAVNKKYRANN